MITARDVHAATLLANGKVLVTGGIAGNATSSSAEVYDPVANIWSPAPPMSKARSYQTATLLGNGKVLIAGGAGTAPSSAELYDPATNTWSAAASMAIPRQSCTATMLLSGKVLLAGGHYDSAAELYDPASNTWSAAPSMLNERDSHAAAALADGRVLVVGGRNNPNFLSAAEIFTPGASPPACVTIQRGVNGSVQDTQIASNADGAHPSGNFGAGLAMIAGTVGVGQRRALIHFDLGSIPAAATITSAVMTLHARSDSKGGAGNQLAVHAVTSAWGEGTVTWSTAPSFNPVVVASDFGGPGTHAFDVTSLAMSWIAGSNNGALLDQNGFYYTSFMTSEDPTALYRPSITVCYTTP